MGVVYRARHVLIDRVVALKLIRPDLRSETHLRAWMLREARAANRVDHAHIVEIHDVGETEDGDLYLVMEYLLGTALSAEVSKGQFPVSRAVDVLEQMCAALARAHDLGVIHRDLKSDNIMLTARGGRRDFVKILDFGLAALARDPRLAPKGAVFGTPEYMSPEQARGEDAAAVSDLYALGILFFEMLTGQLPFRSHDRETLLELQRTGQAPKPRTLRADIPSSAEGIIMRLLEKDPRKRFRDGHHLQEELKALQRALPSTPWDAHTTEAPAPAAAPPPPPAETPGVVEWGTRSSNFARMLARAYPTGGAPPEIQEASDRVWDLASRASRLEGELSSLSRKLDGMEKRGRALRAELGRKVEELAHEESRALREAQSERDRIAKLNASYSEADQRQRSAKARVDELERNPNSTLAIARGPFEELGASRAIAESTRRTMDELDTRAAEREGVARDLRRQIDDLKSQLQRYGDALENDLAQGRERIAKRVREALALERSFVDTSLMLITHLRGRPECRELLDELIRGDSTLSGAAQAASSNAVMSSVPTA